MYLRVLMDRWKNLGPNNPWFLFDGERKIIDRKWLCDRGCEWSFHLAPACGPTPEVKSGAIHQINNGKSIDRVSRGGGALSPSDNNIGRSANRLGFRRVIFFSAILMLIHLFSEFKFVA